MRAAEFMLLNDIELNDSKINSLLKRSNFEAEANLMLNTLACLLYTSDAADE